MLSAIEGSCTELLYFLSHLVHRDGVREASEKTLVLVVGLHEEVEVFPGLPGRRRKGVGK